MRTIIILYEREFNSLSAVTCILTVELFSEKLYTFMEFGGDIRLISPLYYFLDLLRTPLILLASEPGVKGFWMKFVLVSMTP